MTPRSNSSRSLLLALLFCALTTVGCGDSSEPPAETGPEASPSPPAAAGEMPPSEQVATFSGVLDPGFPPEMRLFSVHQLVQMGTPETVPPLTRAMNDPDERVALAAIDGLPQTRDASAIATLEQLASGGSGKLSDAAKKRLGALQ